MNSNISGEFKVHPIPKSDKRGIMKTSNTRESFTEEIKGTTSEITKQVRKLIKGGKARRVIIRNKKGKVLFQSQLLIGMGGVALLAAMAPILSAIGLFAMIMNDIKIIVERYPEEQINEDEYNVEAEIIDIRDDDTKSSPQKATSESASSTATSPEQKTEKEQKEAQADKTVGKKENDE